MKSGLDQANKPNESKPVTYTDRDIDFLHLVKLTKDRVAALGKTQHKTKTSRIYILNSKTLKLIHIIEPQEKVVSIIGLSRHFLLTFGFTSIALWNIAAKPTQPVKQMFYATNSDTESLHPHVSDLMHSSHNAGLAGYIGASFHLLPSGHIAGLYGLGDCSSRYIYIFNPENFSLRALEQRKALSSMCTNLSLNGNQLVVYDGEDVGTLRENYIYPWSVRKEVDLKTVVKSKQVKKIDKNAPIASRTQIISLDPFYEKSVMVLPYTNTVLNNEGASAWMFNIVDGRYDLSGQVNLIPKWLSLYDPDNNPTGVMEMYCVQPILDPAFILV